MSSMGRNSVEYQKILRRYDLVIDQLASARCSGVLADKLRSKKLITGAIYEEALNVGPGVVESTRIRPMINAVLAKVELNTENYYTFLGALDEIDGAIVQQIEAPLEPLKPICNFPECYYLPTQFPECVIRYVEYLKDKYKQFSVLPDGDWPPSIGRHYTELSIIERDERLPTTDETEEMEDCTIRGDVSAIIKTRSEHVISIPAIFLQEMSSNGQIKVLMDGPPGVGKTTMTRKICQDWASNQVLQQYCFVVLLELRNRRICKAKSIEDLLPADDPELKQQVVQYTRTVSGKNILFIFDGYDELSDEQQTQNSLFLDIIKGEVLHNCSVLVTSRPYASDYLHTLNCISRHVEVIGFTEEQMQSCILQNMQNAEAKHLIRMLQEHMNIMSLCYTPLHCAIMLYVYKQEKCALPNTLTKLFGVFIMNALKRHARKLDDYRLLKNLRSLYKLPDPIRPQFEALCKLAYCSFLENKVVFSYEDIESIVPQHTLETNVETNLLSLMTAFKSYTSTSEETSYQFLHLNIQEFLVARWAVITLSGSEEAAFILNHLKENRFRTVLMFMAGLSQLKSPISDALFPEPLSLSILTDPSNLQLPTYQFSTSHSPAPADCEGPCPGDAVHRHAATHFDVNKDFTKAIQWHTAPRSVQQQVSYHNFPGSLALVSHEPRVLFKGNTTVRKFILLTRLIYESQNFTYYPNLLQLLDNKEKFSIFFYRLTPADCTSLAHFLSRVDHRWETVCFHFCALTDHSLEIFQKVFAEHCSDVVVKEFQLYFNAASLSTKLSLLPSIALLRYTESVDIQGLQYPNGISAQQIELHKILDMSCLTDLTISVQFVPDNHLSDYSFIFSRFMDALKNNRTLERLSYEHPHGSACFMFEYTATALKNNTLLHLISQFKFQMGYKCELSLTGQVWNTVCPTVAFHLFQLPCMEHVTKVDFQHATLLKTCSNHTCSISRESALQALENFLITAASEKVKLNLFDLGSSDIKCIDSDIDSGTAAPAINEPLRCLLLEKNELNFNCTLNAATVTFHLASLITKLSLLPRMDLFKTIKSVVINGLQFTNGLPSNQIELHKILDMKCLTNLTISLQSVSDHHLTTYLASFLQFMSALKYNNTLENLLYEHPHNSSCSIFVCTAAALEQNGSLHLNSQFKIQKGYPCEFSLVGKKWTNICRTVLFHFLQLPCMSHTIMKQLEFNNNYFESCPTCSISRDLVMQAIKKFLITNSTISKLYLSQCEFCDQDVEHIALGLAKNMSVEKISITRSNISAEGLVTILNSLKSRTTMATMEISGSWCGENALNYTVRGLVKLGTNTKLTLRIPGIGKVNITGTESMVNVQLEELCEATPSGCACLFKALNQTTTSTLKLSLTKGTFLASSTAVMIFKFLEDNTSLEELSLSGYAGSEQITEDQSKVIGNALEGMLTINRGIKILNLLSYGINNDLGRKIAAGLAWNKSLAVLNLSCNNIHSAGAMTIFTALESNTSLMELNLSGNIELAQEEGEAVGSALMKMLRVNGVIQILKLNNCGINDTILRKIGVALFRNKSLRVLNVSHNNIHSCSTVSMLKHNVALEELNLSWNRLSDGIMTWNGTQTLTDDKAVYHSFEKLLTVNKTIKVLNLQGCGIDKDTGMKIGAGLMKNKSLQVLDMSYNDIRSVSAVSIFKSLKHNTSLEELNLSWNKQLAVADREAVGCTLERMMTENSTLKNLNLNFCCLSDAVAKYLTGGLAHGKITSSLTKLAINHHDEISSGSWVKLFKAILQSSFLTNLDISWNKLGLQATVALAEILACNTSLTELNVGGCYYYYDWETHRYSVREDLLEVLARELLHNSTLQRLMVYCREEKEVFQMQLTRVKYTTTTCTASNLSIGVHFYVYDILEHYKIKLANY